MQKSIYLISACLFSASLVLQQDTFAQEIVTGEEELIVISCGGGRRPEGSFSTSQSTNVNNVDITQQVDDVLITLRNDSLISVLLNSDTDEPLEIASKQVIPGYVDGSNIYHSNILVSDDLVVVLTETQNSADFSFFSLNSYGSLEYQKRYSLSDDTHEVWSFLNSAAIVNNTLVFAGEKFCDESDTKEEFEENLTVDIKAESQSLNSIEKEQVNITQSHQWVNPLRALELNEVMTDVFICPLDSLLDEGLSCDITTIVGVDSYSNFISDQAVYFFGDSYIGGHYGVMAHSWSDYVERTDFELEVFSDDKHSMIYRIDLNYLDVTSVIVEGRLLNSGAYEEDDGVFSALVKKLDSLGANHDLVYGLRFDLSQFSELPVALPESDYQLLSEGEGRVNANRFSINHIALSRTAYGLEASDTNEVIIWNIETEGVVSVESEFPVDDLYFYDEILLGLSVDDKQVKMQTWSVSDEIKHVFTSDFDELYTDTRGFNEYLLGSNYGQRMWGLPIKRLGDDGKPVTFIDNQGAEVDIHDMQYFELSDNGVIHSIGKLFATPELIEEQECEVSCDEWYGLERSFRVSDSVYAILGDEVLKGRFEKASVDTISNVHFISNDPESE